MLASRVLPLESTFLQHVLGCLMLHVANGLKPFEAGLPGEIDHGLQRLSGESFFPGIPGKNVAGDGAG